jgi:2-keto-3-deoxy-L-rhamnonate aldolase RhmA
MTVAGFDWPFLDMEHGVMSLDAAQPHQPLTSTNTGLRLD